MCAWKPCVRRHPRASKPWLCESRQKSCWSAVSRFEATSYAQCMERYHAALGYAALCCAVPCCAVLCHAVPCPAVLCCAVLCCAVLCCAVLCCAVLCCAASRVVSLCRRPSCLQAALRCAVAKAGTTVSLQDLRCLQHCCSSSSQSACLVVLPLAMLYTFVHVGMLPACCYGHCCCCP